MLTFSFEREISINRDGKPLLIGLRPWVFPEEGERIFLTLKELTETRIIFKDADGCVDYTLYIEEDNNCSALKVMSSYHPKALDDIRGRNHLNTKEALGVDIDAIQDMGKYMANYMNCAYWARPFIGKNSSLIPDRTQSLLWQMSDGEYGFALTVCDKDFKSNLRGNEDGSISLYLFSNYCQNQCNSTAIIFGFGADPYALPAVTTEYGLKIMGKNGGLRKERRYPEIFEYLGWCSWDAFHMDVSHDDLISKAKEFKDKKIPVRWMLIDDMWAEVHNNNRKTMHSRELFDFEADPSRFAQGLKGAITDLKEKYSMRVGVWHPTTGYWHGIDPDGVIAKRYKNLLTVALNGQLIHSPDFDKAFLFYYAFHSFLRDCGADFVKLDYQGFINVFLDRLMPIGQASSNLHEAIEASVGVCFDGNLINCMGMSNENYWNRPKSVINRISGDFQPENRKWFVQHLLQCSFNSLIQGCIYVGDWDMWWSDDEQATKNAVLRAMSGGPVYVSDELGRSVKETIMPIVYKDGRIIRLENPAMPTEDCLLDDAEHNGRIFKVWNRIGGCGVIAAFNLDEEERTVSGTVSVSDVAGLEDGQYVFFDYFARTATVLSSTESLSVSLENYDDFRLLFIIPICDGIAPVGLINKYMSPATFESIGKNKWQVKDSGEFVIYSDKHITEIIVDGMITSAEMFVENLYMVAIQNTAKPVLLELPSACNSAD